MASFVSALDRPGATSDTSNASRWRACLKFLRHVERVDINADMARNWDARKCFVIHVLVKDDEVKDANDNDAQLLVVRPIAPFQIERTPKELEQLQTAMQEWSSKHSPNDAISCAFCSPIASGDVVATAKQASGEASPVKSRGVFSSLFKRREKLKGPEEWEAWLNASIEQLRRVDVDATPVCQGLEHVPALLARFLLQEFASDVIM